MKKYSSSLHNYMEDVTGFVLDDMLNDMAGICRCSKCRLDILAIALNNLSPKYVVTEKGRIYAKLEELELQLKADVARELTKAMGVVKKRPQH
jgi:competence protein ComFB